MIEYSEGEGEVFLARDISRPRNYSEETARLIDAEIKRFIDEAYQHATEILTEDRAKVELIAKALLEFETLDAEQIRDLIETGEMRNPPTSPKPPALPEEYRKKDAPKPKDGGTPEDDGPLPGAVVGAPA
jgi:cell division protease FtsH